MQWEKENIFSSWAESVNLARSVRANRFALAPPLCVIAKWAQDADVAHRSVTVAICAGPAHPGILSQFSLARVCTAVSLESHRCHTRLVTVVACCRWCRAASPTHGASGLLVPLTRSNYPLRCQCACCCAAEPPQCPGTSHSTTSRAQHVGAGVSCHLPCVRSLATEPSVDASIGRLHICHLARTWQPLRRIPLHLCADSSIQTKPHSFTPESRCCCRCGCRCQRLPWL
jgi:hypothetical protein